MLRSLVLALAVAGAFSFSLAHRTPLPTSQGNLARSVIADTVEIIPWSEVVSWAESQTTRTIRWGRYVRYGGTLILAGSLIYTALDWFYNEAQRTTNTPLDDWWFSNPAGGYVWDSNQLDLRPSADSNLPCLFRLYPADIYTSVRWYVNGQQYRYILFAEDDYPDHRSQARAWAEEQSRTDTCNPRQPLPDYLRSHPDAADGVIDVVTDYIDEYPDLPLTFDSPIPGLSLDPAPNGNQWFDNPFFDPLLDTDNDGWPDWFEFDLYSDPSNPASQPPSTADPDNDGYDNASERDAGTDPTDPNSRPDIDVDQDSDGDGIADSADPCPSDPTNTCQPEEDPQEEDIPDPNEPSLTPVELPQFDQPTLPDISSRFDQVEANFRDRLDSLWSTLQDRFPFGMARWIPQPPSVGGGSCDMSVTLQIPDLPSAQVDICNNPVMQWAATTGRQLVLVSLIVGFLFAVARRASGA